MSEQHQRCDSGPAVTSSASGRECDQQLRVTRVSAITASHTFTLVFPNKAIAVLHIHGPLSQDEARAFAASVLPRTSYEVRNGDETHGHVAPFHAWTSAAAQEALSLREARIRRLTRRRREQMKVEALRAWISGEEPPRQRKRNLLLLRNVPAEGRLAWLRGATDIELAELCGEIEAVIDGLQAETTRLSDETRAAHLREAKAIEDVLDLEEMRRLVVRVQRRGEGVAAQEEAGQ